MDTVNKIFIRNDRILINSLLVKIFTNGKED